MLRRMLNKIPLVAISSLKYCEKAMVTQKVSADPEAFFSFQRISDRVFLTLWVRAIKGALGARVADESPQVAPRHVDRRANSLYRHNNRACFPRTERCVPAQGA